MNQKGFIPIIFIIIIGVVVATSATFGVVKYKDEITANVSNVFKNIIDVSDTESTGKIKESGLSEESIVEEKSETEGKQDDAQKLQEQLRIAEQKQLEAEKQLAEEKTKQAVEKAKAEADAFKKAQEEAQRQLEAQRIAEEQRKQEELQRQQETQRLAEEQEKKRAEEEAIIRAEQELQQPLEAQRLAEELRRQEEQARREAEERERQRQAEYSYYIQKLTTIRNTLLNDKEAIPSAMNQIDNWLNQDKNNAYLDYQNALSIAEQDYNRRIREIGEYYAERGLAYSGRRNAAEAEAREDYEFYAQGLENQYNRYCSEIESYYNQKKEALRQSLITIDSQMNDIDYLIARLQQKTLSEADKLLLIKALSY